MAELKHIGVLGMRWGRRKNKISGDSHNKTRLQKDDDRSLPKSRGKSLNEMDNKELQELVTRMNLERQYKDLTRKPDNVIVKMVEQQAGELAKSFVRQGMTYGVNILIKEVKKRAAV